MRCLVFLMLSLGMAGSSCVAQESKPSGSSRGAEKYTLTGLVITASGEPMSHAQILEGFNQVFTSSDGTFSLRTSAGIIQLQVLGSHGEGRALSLTVNRDQDIKIIMPVTASINVNAETTSNILTSDPDTDIYESADLLPANPGRPGTPFSIPGLPVETASGGIKAPQYFSPGVAGDHGEPISQYLAINGSLFPNNLSANAHGNGYADPNIVIPATIDSVKLQDPAFNARYGNHAVELATTYNVNDRLTPFLATTTDGRDATLSGAWAPGNPNTREWIAFQASLGNGFLERPEERQQYDINFLRSWKPGAHDFTAYLLGYYGFSRVPGLIPLYTPVPGDTIDSRQADLTHTTLGFLADDWHISGTKELQSSAYLRTYSLALRSNFGDGLIRQSEFRTVEGGSSDYMQRLSSKYSFLAAVDSRRDAPRGLDLGHADATGIFRPVTSNDLTIIDTAPFFAIKGEVTSNLNFYVGVRRDEIQFDNRDNLFPSNSFNRLVGTTSPKLSFTIGRPDAPILPAVSLSFGKTFHTNDPRIGDGSGQPSLVIQTRVFQLLASKVVDNTEFRLVLQHVTNSQEFAKIDPDTGLQESLGPSRNQFMTISAKRENGFAFVQASYSQADAVDLQLHQPVPEAPRLIVDALGHLKRLPRGLQAEGEFEYVGEKPLGNNFNAMPVREIRLELQKSFHEAAWTLSLNGLLANGASGQTLETLALSNESTPVERIVGVPLRSYASLAVVHRFGKPLK